ncbi:MAG TPA: LysR family transcriptional regulator [Pseudonocardiaceae bacterium]|nr:LysR family transcriptional regulator [Pseudonocardiaceae bacterium]
MLELRRLHLLHQFALRGSITATAAAVGYSPSAVSQQLAALERETGAALLERSARSAVLTDAGRTLAAHANRVLSAVEAAEADLASLDTDLAGRIVIGVIPTTATLLAPALADLQGRHPRLEIELRQAGTREALNSLRTRELDVAVIDRWAELPVSPDRELTRLWLLDDRLVLALPPSHPLGKVGGPLTLDADALDGQPLLCTPADQPSRQATDRLLSAHGAVPATRWEFEGLATIATLVAYGTGIAVLPQLALHDLAPNVAITRPLDPTRHRRIDAHIRTASRRRPTVIAVLTALQQATASAEQQH